MSRRPLKYIEQVPYWVFLYQEHNSASVVGKMCGVPEYTINNYMRWLGLSDPDNRRKTKLGPKNPMWAGDKVKYIALHDWVRRNLDKPLLCPDCKTKPPLDVANVSKKYDGATYNRDLKNWEWLCRRCHMIRDGRMEIIKKIRGNRKRDTKVR